MILYVGKTRLLLNDDEVARTLQINDLFNLETRQSNYSNKIRIPKTPEAIKEFGLLGIVGSTSKAPYIRNEVSLYSDSAECFVYKGWAVVKSTSEYYEINIYDGNIDIYKAIEGKKLSDIPMPDLEHQKTPQNVVESMTEELKYRYMLANFGGKVESMGGNINIDYLAPFASVKYILDSIFLNLGFTYSGTIFNSSKWTDLWLSFPKGTYSAEPIIDEIEATNGATTSFINSYVYFNEADITENEMKMVNDGQGLVNSFVANIAGEYTFTISGNSKTMSFHAPAQIVVFISKGNNTNASTAVVSKVILEESVSGMSDTPINGECKIFLEEGEMVSVVHKVKNNTLSSLNSITLTITRKESLSINFQESLIDWSVQDFFKEVLVKFGLTPYKSKYTNHYTFYTLEELMKRENTIDVSDRFISVEEEIYLYSNYAQNNRFKYKYDVEGVDYYDGNIVVFNENLPFESVSIASKTFAPIKVENGDDMWKLYDREVNDNGEVSYKNLSGRFYFATSKLSVKSLSRPITFSSSLTTLPNASTHTIYSPSFAFQKFEYIVSNYYGAINRILQDTKVVTANMRLDDVFIANFDFTKPLYIKQLGGNFIVNKIINYVSGKPKTKVELLKVELFDRVAKRPLLALDDGTIYASCSTLKKVRLNVDNVIGSIEFEDLPKGSSIRRKNANTFILEGNNLSSEIRAKVTTTDGLITKTNTIKLTT